MAEYLYECQYGDITRYEIVSKTAKTVMVISWRERRMRLRCYHFFSFEDAVAYIKNYWEKKLDRAQDELLRSRSRLLGFDDWVADKKKSFEAAGEPK